MGLLRPTLKRQVPYRKEDVFAVILDVVPEIKGFKIVQQDFSSFTIRVKTSSTLIRTGATIDIVLLEQPDKKVIVEMVATSNIPTQVVDLGDTMTKSMEQIFERLNLVLQSFKPIEESSGFSSDVAQQIRELAKLREEGILSEEEFMAKKRKLLDL